MNLRILLVMLMLTVSSGAADRPSEIPLWPQGAPGSEGKPMKEVVTTSASGELSVSGSATRPPRHRQKSDRRQAGQQP